MNIVECKESWAVLYATIYIHSATLIAGIIGLFLQLVEGHQVQSWLKLDKQLQIKSNEPAKFTSTKWPALKVIIYLHLLKFLQATVIQRMEISSDQDSLREKEWKKKTLGQPLQFTGLHTVNKQKAEAVMINLRILVNFFHDEIHFSDIFQCLETIWYLWQRCISCQDNN